MQPQSNEEAQTQMQLEIEKRRTDNDKEILTTLRRIMKVPVEIMSEADKGFLRTRVSYLTKAEADSYAEILNAPAGQVTTPQPTRSELNQKALELGIESPEKFKSKTDLVAAIAEKEV